MAQEIKQKCIGIDARFYGPVGKGLGRYTKEIVDNVIGIDNVNEYVIFLSKENFNDFAVPNSRVKKVLADVRWYTLSEQILMPFYIWREKLDLIHFPHFNVPWFCPTKFVVTIHDLILTKFPTQRSTTLSPLFYKIKNFGYKLIINNAIKKSEKIITVSEFTKNDIIKQFSGDNSELQKKIFVTYEGIFHEPFSDLQKNDKDVVLRYNINRPFLLYVGNAYPHKNLEGLIEVFASISKKNSNLLLVLVGGKDYFFNRLIDFARQFKEIEENIIFPGYVPDAELLPFYRQALAYVFPSFYEGFGLPPLEAMSVGCPVISANTSCLPEILDDAALYFDPYSKIDMQNKIEGLVVDEESRQILVAKGLAQAKKYSWLECAQKTLNIYNKIIDT